MCGCRQIPPRSRLSCTSWGTSIHGAEAAVATSSKRRSLVCGHALRLGFQTLRLRRRRFAIRSLASQLFFESRQLSFDILLRLAFPNHFFAVSAQEVVDGLDPDANRPGRLVLVKIFKTEIWGSGPVADAFDPPVDGRVVTALEARNFERHQVRMSRRELRSPDFVIGAAG